MFVEKLPIPNFSVQHERQISQLVNQVTESAGKSRAEPEIELDLLIMSIIGLNQDERRILRTWR